MKAKKILIVDDETPITDYLSKKLGKLGYEVSVAQDGPQALDLAFSLVPDIIILDVKLPKMDGLAVAKALKGDEKTQNTPILMLSAKAQPEEIEAGLRSGADKYLCKPLGFPDILKEIHNFE